MRTLILGLGNPILGDDGIGIYTAKVLRDRLKGVAEVDVKELSVGGLRIFEEIIGYDRVILIDAIITGRGAAGEVYRFTPKDFDNTLHLSSPHDINFTTALELGRVYAQEETPKEVVIYAIEVKENLTFTEDLSAEVRAGGLRVAEMILEELKKPIYANRGG
ncbi:MAG: hydrogenase maturation protease [Candidatus Bathyarchaeia archaeon]